MYVHIYSSTGFTVPQRVIVFAAVLHQMLIIRQTEDYILDNTGEEDYGKDGLL